MYSSAGAYDIVQVLGKGTFGEVAKCWKRNTGQYVAIKILKNDADRKRIARYELKMLRILKTVDPDEFHLVRFFEYFSDDAKFYLVFELLEKNLFEFQKENNFSPLPVQHIRTITTQLLRALQKMNDLSLIHADIKPENIMIVDQMQYPFRVKVIDFGSASVLQDIQQVKRAYIQSRFYRAPEILLGLPFCEKVDMWSLGCVMAELHLGCPLYPGNNEYDQVRYIVETQEQPTDRLLNLGSKAHYFFKRNTHPHSLVTLFKTILPDSEVVARVHDCKNMVGLLKRMLALDSPERISASAALLHTFITMEQLKTRHGQSEYCELSVQGLNAALKYKKPEFRRSYTETDMSHPKCRKPTEQTAQPKEDVTGIGNFNECTQPETQSKRSPAKTLHLLLGEGPSGEMKDHVPIGNFPQEPIKTTEVWAHHHRQAGKIISKRCDSQSTISLPSLISHAESPDQRLHIDDLKAEGKGGNYFGISDKRFYIYNYYYRTCIVFVSYIHSLQVGRPTTCSQCIANAARLTSTRGWRVRMQQV
uniref:Protein kinase domain-containing protein n=1 Tax=Callorhinchus milii TaxID=7868 RepID=A0A4W3JYV5_CALMI